MSDSNFKTLICASTIRNPNWRFLQQRYGRNQGGCLRRGARRLRGGRREGPWLRGQSQWRIRQEVSFWFEDSSSCFWLVDYSIQLYEWSVGLICLLLALCRGYVGIHSSGFRDFLLKPELLRAIVDSGFEHPSEGVHRSVIPPILPCVIRDLKFIKAKLSVMKFFEIQSCYLN